MAETQAKPRNDIALQMEQMAPKFAEALPAHIPVERFARVVMTAVQNNTDLLAVSRKSLWNAAIKAAQDGLLPDGREGAIVPYKGEAQWMPMIAGLRKKVRNSGEIATWDVQAVYENDHFEFELGDDPFIKHRPALSGRGKLIAVYSVATLKTGEKTRDVMSVEDVEAVRSKSRSQRGPWSDPVFYPEMAKKTVARRHSKVLPMSTDLDDLLRRDDNLYDLESASDAQVKAKPRDLESRLGSLAAPTALLDTPDHNDDGEIIEGEAEAVDSGEPEAEAVDPLVAAKDAGRKARADGMSRKAVPGDFRAADRKAEADAWLAGYDEEANNG